MIAFRDADQRRRACRTLLSAAGLSNLWTVHGPTETAVALVAAGARAFSAGERVVLLAVWSLWTAAAPSLRLDQLVGLPDAEPLLHLIIASFYGPDAIEAWLTRPKPEGFVFGDDEARAVAARLFDEARAVLAENGDCPINMTAAPDACALGVRQMADYAMIVGVDVVEDDEQRHQRALQLAVHALGVFATLSASKWPSAPPR